MGCIHILEFVITNVQSYELMKRLTKHNYDEHSPKGLAAV